MSYGMSADRLRAAMEAAVTEHRRQRVERLCRVDWCNARHEAGGYCKRHYAHLKLTGDPISDLERRIVNGVLGWVERRQGIQLERMS